VRGVTLAFAVALALAGTAARAAPSAQHVTLIGDSVADAIGGDTEAVHILSQGMNVDLELAACRRVDEQSCWINGYSPPNVVQLAQSMGSRLGRHVVVAVGYNDFEHYYAQNIENALAAFRAAGVKRVWWLTLRAAHHSYLTMNDDIKAAAQKHPELSVIDWNVYSRSHPDWFQPDGLHLVRAGAEAMATLIHKRLVFAGVAAPPVSVTTRWLPLALRGKPFRLKLIAVGGVPPFRWSLLERAPTGIHLLQGGLVEGRPRARPGRYTFDIRVTDSSGYTATRRLTFRVAG
jgi:hypothetical protein